jgi:uncharacterized protein (TIGR02246 family)
VSVGAEADERLALRALVDSYAQAVDGRDADRFAGLFAADGELVVFEPEEDEPSISWRGPDELREVMKLLSSYSTTFHLMANHTCELDGDSASGEVYCLAHHLTEEGADGDNTLMVIRYRDRYTKVDRAWRFARRDVLRQWTEHHSAERARLV